MWCFQHTNLRRTIYVRSNGLMASDIFPSRHVHNTITCLERHINNNTFKMLTSLIFLPRLAELLAFSSRKHDDRQPGHLHRRLPAEASGVDDGLLLVLLQEGGHRSGRKVQLLQGHRGRQPSLQHSHWSYSRTLCWKSADSGSFQVCKWFWNKTEFV